MQADVKKMSMTEFGALLRQRLQESHKNCDLYCQCCEVMQRSLSYTKNMELRHMAALYKELYVSFILPLTERSSY